MLSVTAACVSTCVFPIPLIMPEIEVYSDNSLLSPVSLPVFDNYTYRP